MVFKRSRSSLGFKALLRAAARWRGVVLARAAFALAGCSLFWAGPARPFSLAQASCAPDDFADAKVIGGVLCGLAAAGLGGCFFRLRRWLVEKQIKSAMGSAIAAQDQCARRFQDDLIQGVQGLIITLQLVAQNNPTARAAIEDALIRAETFLIQSRDRLQPRQGAGADGQAN